jgi:hypothetical protein
MNGSPQPGSGDHAASAPEDFARYTRRMCDTAALGLQAVLSVDGNAFRRAVRLSRTPVSTSPAGEDPDKLLAVLALVLGRLSNVQQIPLSTVIDELVALAGGDPIGAPDRLHGRT